MNAIIRHLVEEHGFDQVDAEMCLEGWEIIPIQSGETVIGHLAKSGSEIHTVLFPEYRGSAKNRAVIRKYHELLKDCVFLTTRVPVGDTADIPITEGVGFKEVRRDSAFVYYWMDEQTVIGGKKDAKQRI